MDVKHLCGINIGLEFDNFPSFLNLWCIHTTKFDIYLQKLPMLYNNIVLQYVFATISTIIQLVHYEHNKFIQNEKQKVVITDVEQPYWINIHFRLHHFFQFMHNLCMHQTASDITSNNTCTFKKKFVAAFLCNKSVNIGFVQYEHNSSTRSILF